MSNKYIEKLEKRLLSVGHSLTAKAICWSMTGNTELSVIRLSELMVVR